MKIVFTGAGTGGHFYPLIAIAESIHDVTRERMLVAPKLYYIADKPFDEQALLAQGITYVKCPAGKVRRYFSFKNFLDIFVTIGGVFSALTTLLLLYPDAVISKGGYSSVPVVFAAHLLRIPIIIHESDSKPGRANLFASKYAYRIGVAFESAIPFFPQKSRSKIARIGIPIRKEVSRIEPEGAKQELGLDADAPTVIIFGGSLGSRRINEVVLAGLLDLVGFANVIHQTGKGEFKDVETTARVILEGNPHASRYHVFPYLSADSIRRAAGAADIVVSRAGATAIAEISLWAKPAILIPIPESVSHDQRTNAYAYAHTGAAVVLEESNMTPHVLVSEILRITNDRNLSATMSAHAAGFASADAGHIIAEEVIRIGLSHDPIETTPAV